LQQYAKRIIRHKIGKGIPGARHMIFGEIIWRKVQAKAASNLHRRLRSRYLSLSDFVIIQPEYWEMTDGHA
jgi:hypothetical protein